jgi:predicted CXXCH cytochrome family protein
MIVLMVALFLALPMVASANLIGDCYDCHTMHNSEQGTAVIATAQQNLLRFDCLGCHAQDATGGTKNWTGPGGSIIPQVAHGGTTDLAGGNFNQTTSRKVHSVSDITGAGIAPVVPLGENKMDQPPGLPHTSQRHVFTSETATDAFDMFTCAGARGCHGTRSQALFADTVTNATGGNNWEVITRRTGIAAISGSHHNNMDGAAVTSDGYGGVPAAHDGAVVAAGYRFIPGLQGFENTAREYVSATDHNEYYGDDTGFGTGCGACHIQDTSGNGRQGYESGITVPNNTQSGFCSTCHGYFHSSGGDVTFAGGGTADYQNNGVSGAFLRHPSDYVIPNSGEYAAYTAYDPTAPVARPSVVGSASGTVTPGADLVSCLSCHVAHGSENDYMLRFDYTTMTAGDYPSQAAAQAAGGCLACHTLKGVLPVNRP